MKKIMLDLLYFWRKLVKDIVVSKKGEVYGVVKIREQNFEVNIIPMGTDIHRPTKKSLRGPTISELNIIIKYFWCIFYKEKLIFFSQPTNFRYNFFIIKTTPAPNLSIKKEIEESSELELDKKYSLENFIEIKRKIFKEKTLTPKTYEVLIEPL